MQLQLPLHILDIDESETDPTKVFACAYVNNPATERKYLAFDGEVKRRVFEVVDDEKRILAGFLMVADQPIYRRDPDGKEYYVAFPAKSINKIVAKLGKSAKPLTFNYDHTDNKPSNSSYLQQHFIINSELGINTPKGFEEAPDGSWFGFVKVEDENEWNEAKKRGGFSVEGYFNDIKIMDAEQSVYEELKNKILSCLN